MARHVRIRVSGGMYHVCARGHNRGMLFCCDADREHFLELLQEARERFRLRVYAFCLMPNHYHVLVGTPEGNISQGMQWVNGSYGIWYNRRHDRTGHLFGERFKAVLVEDGNWLLSASVYVHMNCVAVESMGLGKKERAVQRKGMAKEPTVDEVDMRLKALREYRWSSYRCYAGYEKMPEWLDSGVLLRRAKQEGKEPVKCYRDLVEDKIKQGVDESIGAQTKWGLILGGERFARKVRRHLKVVRESKGRTELSRWMSFGEIVKIVERLKKAKWEEFRDRSGDEGRDLVLWACRRFSGMTLREVGECASGMDYSAVAVSVIRFVKRSKTDRKLRKLMKKVADKCQM